MVELRNVISGISPRRISDEHTTMVDLTGLAVQAIEIAKIVYESSASL